MQQKQRTLAPAAPPVGALYLVEGITSVGSMMLMVGVFFYTEHRFHWTLVQNFLLACTQGAVYTIGALSADRIQRRFGRRRSLMGLYSIMALLAAVGLFATSQVLVLAILLIYTAPVGMSWPALESLVASGVDSAQMSRRLSLYNLVWAGAGAIAVGGNGALIEHWPVGVFVVPMVMHALSVALVAISSASRD